MSTVHVVTGAGPVGSTVAQQLAEAGHAVRLLTRSGSGPVHPLIERRRVDVSQPDALAEAFDGALVHDPAAVAPGAGAEVDHVVGDHDRLRLVLHDEHGVALVPQLQQQRVHPLDVMGIQPDGGLVEDVGDVGE